MYGFFGRMNQNVTNNILLSSSEKGTGVHSSCRILLAASKPECLCYYSAMDEQLNTGVKALNLLEEFVKEVHKRDPHPYGHHNHHLCIHVNELVREAEENGLRTEY